MVDARHHTHIHTHIHIASSALRPSNEVSKKERTTGSNDFKMIPDDTRRLYPLSPITPPGQSYERYSDEIMREVHEPEYPKESTLHDDDVSRYCWPQPFFPRILERAV